ncbi:uncharacterized protein HaLaN_32774 [Haematococcus lacustris]|uniref:Uncharacterized protein n=1 Tax=Haematococcus lacustris TaxID=44745 RepID=A0A6A0AKN1_HAELA|nr:uncharacterized protein HaLaN_32774 [Haematococcus lacustris]
MCGHVVRRELWFPAFPVLVYFKETQTKPEGQIHFFPIIFNGRQLYDVMVERCGPSATSGPKGCAAAAPAAAACLSWHGWHG